MSMGKVPVFFILLILRYGYCGKQQPEFSEEIREIIQHVHNECVGKTGVAEDTKPVSRVINHLHITKNVSPTTPSHRLESIVLEKSPIRLRTLKRPYSPLPPEDIQNCEKGIFKEDTKLKCYMFCLLEEASLADEDGTVDYDMLVSLIPEQYYDRVTKMLFACKHLDTKDKDKCQRAFDVHKCSYTKDPDFYFLF